MFRGQLIKKQEKSEDKDVIRWRSHEVFRIEAFSDAVFAFAVTLLIVALEVPKNFGELKEGMRGFFGFGLCFALLFQIWYTQYIFFRRYGLQDTACTALNGFLLFVVLFFVYPLKFLTSLLMFSNEYEEGGQTFHRIGLHEVPQLMIIYGAGFALVFSTFVLLYSHAYRRRAELELSALEIFETKTQIYRNIAFVCIGVFSMTLAAVLSPQLSGLAGFAYILIWPTLTILHSFRGKRRRALEPQAKEPTLEAERVPAAEPAPLSE